MFPPPAPEQCLVQVLIPDSEKQRLSDVAISSGRLDRVGAGAILAYPVIKRIIHKVFL